MKHNQLETEWGANGKAQAQYALGQVVCMLWIFWISTLHKDTL